MVKSVFFSPEAETILVILISSTLPEDSTIWNATPNVKFLVMSAYKLAMDLRKQVERGCSSNDGALKKKKKKNFTKIWKLQFPNKVKHFGWRAL